MAEISLQNKVPHFEMSSLLTCAFEEVVKMGCSDLLCGIPTSSLSDGSSSSMSPTGSTKEEGRRKRKRVEVANPGNTLDGLVARRAEDAEEEIGKRYMSETEAIESPDEQTELRRMETDPDVSTRTCSICGYQGKWVSEMIRHKRVHTTDRPFKCRYCSRTSKWKADLIRHVAKTHGIRVVSKYSRSKTFDPNTAASKGPEENKTRVFACEEENTLKAPIRPKPLHPQRFRSQTYSCNKCIYEEEALSVFMSHIHTQHNASMYSCRCGQTLNSLDEVREHEIKNGHPFDMISPNFTVVYNKEALSALSVSTTLSPSSSSSASSAISDLSIDSGMHTDTDESDCEMKYCLKCSFKCSSKERMQDHAASHQERIMKCSLCPFICTRSDSLETHFKQHLNQSINGFLSHSALGMSSPLGPLSPLFPATPLDLTNVFLSLQNSLLSMSSAMSSSINPLAALINAKSTVPLNPIPATVPVSQCHSNRCTLCEAVFSDSASLSSHLSFHGSGLRHSCKLCNYAVGTQVNLFRHLKTHHRCHSEDILVSLPELPEDDSEEEALNVEM